LQLAAEAFVSTPAGAPVVCGGCLGSHDARDLEACLMVCPDCGYHLRLGARDRLRFLLDAGSFSEWDAEVVSANPLGFVDQTPYPVRLSDARLRTGEREAVVTGQGAIRGRPCGVAVFEFGFMGGSMGSAVGEKLLRLFARATDRGLPVVVVTASGGARMQEGILSLMQMAKVTVALQRFRARRLLHVSLLTDPTTGGVAACPAAQGDVVIAEPGAQIGFAGPRVIEQTIRAPLPAGFQRAERLLERGLLDAVVPRHELRDWLDALCSALAPRGAHA
jgi:acetyl-CoA carboxylase carboxyl transferase subunit beta